MTPTDRQSLSDHEPLNPLGVLEINLAVIFVRHHLALEVVCGADFCESGRAGQGPVIPRIPGGPTRLTIPRESAHKFQARLPSGTQNRICFFVQARPRRFRGWSQGSGSPENLLAKLTRKCTARQTASRYPGAHSQSAGPLLGKTWAQTIGEQAD